MSFRDKGSEVREFRNWHTGVIDFPRSINQALPMNITPATSEKNLNTAMGARDFTDK